MHLPPEATRARTAWCCALSLLAAGVMARAAGAAAPPAADPVAVPAPAPKTGVAASGDAESSAYHAPATRPAWELGLGVGVVFFDDYRGADTSHAYPLPIPYFIYRGKILRSDQNGLRGRFLNQDRIEINLSVNGTTPVRSNSARHGMPDLRPTVEVGASLDTHLWRSADARVRLDLRLPVRAAFTAQASPHYVGIFAAPQLDLDISQLPHLTGWQLGLLAGPLFATRRYDDYFYSVAPQYATASRPAYEAGGGYAGTQALASITRRYPTWWAGAFVRHDSLAGASFADSPLVRRNSYWTAGIAAAWIIARSARSVGQDE
ncbi:MAG: MipA/OmpV family protein [Proteobacteria bacterium]|nr:MipA/OmpV family protein [Pseudomonadota bacterium]